MWKRRNNGIPFIWLHGTFESNTQFHVVTMEQPTKQSIDGFVGARNYWKTKIGTFSIQNVDLKNIKYIKKKFAVKIWVIPKKNR